MTDATETVGSADGAEMRLNRKLFHTNTLFDTENNLILWEWQQISRFSSDSIISPLYRCWREEISLLSWVLVIGFSLSDQRTSQTAFANVRFFHLWLIFHDACLNHHFIRNQRKQTWTSALVLLKSSRTRINYASVLEPSLTFSTFMRLPVLLHIIIFSARLFHCSLASFFSFLSHISAPLWNRFLAAFRHPQPCISQTELRTFVATLKIKKIKKKQVRKWCKPPNSLPRKRICQKETQMFFLLWYWC